MLYVDTSVVVRALLVDEQGHTEARDLFIQHTRVVTARWTRLEAVAAVMR